MRHNLFNEQILIRSDACIIARLIQIIELPLTQSSK